MEPIAELLLLYLVDHLSEGNDFHIGDDVLVGGAEVRDGNLVVTVLTPSGEKKRIALTANAVEEGREV